jgi:hypothetical protein
MTVGSHSHDVRHFKREDGKRGDRQVGCGLVAFLGHEMSRFAASCMAALATTLLPEHPVLGASRSTIA